MATDRPRIQVYIDPELYKHYQDWKQERGIEKDSAAFNELLKEFFGEKVIQSEIANPGYAKEDIEELIAEECQAGLNQIKEEVAAKLPTKQQIDARVDDYLDEKFKELNVFRMEFKTEVWLQLKNQFAIWNKTLQEGLSRVNARIEAVEDKLDIKDGMPSLLQEALHTVEQQRWVIEDLLSKSKGELGSESLDETRSPQEPPGLVEESSEVESSEVEAVKKSELPDESPDKLPDKLSQTELAQRLNCHKSQVSRHSKQSDFEEWTKERDPDAIAWNYDPKSKRYLSVK